MNYERPELRDRLAAEYVLGTMHGGARRRFKALLRRSFVLQQAVENWQAQLSPMATGMNGPGPAPDLWRKIEGRIGGAQQPALGSIRSDERLGERSGKIASRLADWLGIRPLAALAMGLCLGIGTMLALPLFKQPPVSVAQLPESYAGFLQNGQGRTAMLVSSLRHGTIVDIKVLVPQTVPEGKRLILWAIPTQPADATTGVIAPPFALGEVVATGKGRLTLADTSEKLLSKVGELAVSVETREAPLPKTPAQPYLLRGACGKFW